MKRTRIGGTDISKLAGFSRYGGPLDVYRQIVEGYEVKETRRMRLGKALEPVVRAEYLAETGAQLVTPRPKFIEHPKHAFMGGTPDDLRTDAVGVEYKTASLSVATEWGPTHSDQVPTEYLLQCAWYLALTDLPEWDLAVLIAADEFRCYRLKRDPELEGQLIEIAAKFWRDHVEKRVPPPPDGTDGYAKYLAERYPEQRAPLRPATPEETALALELRQKEAQLERLEEQCAKMKNALKAHLGDAEGLQGNGFKLTWRKTKDSTRIDWEGVAKALNPPEQIVKAHTSVSPGVRRFLTRWENSHTNDGASH
jgi:predicted phage-related endonuclease